jgi:hypothetical protein
MAQMKTSQLEVRRMVVASKVRKVRGFLSAEIASRHWFEK